ncbi:MAG: class I SAM-dependent methyltransferase [Spirochaetia bacterium]|nr:class I SAM-dependent methyltransferase [Spirochaetia bacterium]
MAIKSFNEIAEIYDKNLEELLGKYMKGGTEKYAEYKVQLIHNLLKTHNINSILDFGCGVGRSLKYLTKYYPQAELWGCDIADEELQIAKKIFPKVSFFNNGYLEEFSSGEKSFDLIFTSCVMHHINPTERKAWVKAVLNRLNKGGYWAIFEHNLINPYTKKIVIDKDNKSDDINWMFSRKKLIKLFEGITDVNIFWQGYTLFFPFRFTSIQYHENSYDFSYFLTNCERLFKWCPLGAQQCIIVKNKGE